MAFIISLPFFGANNPVMAETERKGKPHALTNPTPPFPKLYEQVGKYLNSEGLGKEIDRQEHYMYTDSMGGIHINRLYVFGGRPYIEQYDFMNVSEPDGIGGVMHFLNPFPTQIIWDGETYLNISRGVDGDEYLLQREDEIKKPVQTPVNLEGEPV